ncbi:MAG TPA: IS21-like element helper ATPase IstB, partial [Bacteriovoracaceae bacterium]|nr:IS21-like element helper ATPase IstB [Bacteriovoracaceae bacterium]
MLLSPTLEKLRLLKLTGMAKGLEEQQKLKSYQDLNFEERLGHLVDYEQELRENKKLSNRLVRARLKQQACIEDITYQANRNLDRALIRKLATCAWIKDHHNIIITGLTGVGKSYIGCALAHKACLEGYTSLYTRAPRLFSELETAKADGRYVKVLEAFAKVDLLIIDDWGLTKLNAREERELLEVMEDRYERKSTIFSSQVPVKDWHELIPNKTIADAVLDRVVHNSYRIDL